MRAIDDFDVLVLPGWHGSDPGHWQSLWENAFPTMRRVEQADWERPAYVDWAPRLDDEVARCTRPVVLVAHSLGTSLAMRWTAEGRDRGGKVRGAFLAACSDRDRWEVPGEFPAGFGPMVLRPLPFRSIVLASRDDPRVTPARARDFSEAWGAAFVDVGALGHIGATSGLGLWPAGLVWLGGLLASLGDDARAVT